MFSKKRGIYVCEDCSCEYVPRASFSPLRVFISYGHDNHAAFAKKLKDDLRARGHEVWFDAERLVPGADWESYIEEGLEWVAETPGNGRVVLIMTPHSVRRPGGFCLNEIARAVQNQLHIIPVMLVWSELPLSVCRIQWLDMQDCIPFEERTNRYEAKLGMLIEALEQDKLDYEGMQSRLLGVLEPLPFDADIMRHLARFTGRHWMMDRIKAWMNDRNGQKILWITGAPGAGKTAMASYLCENYREVLAFHLCRHGDSNKSDPRRCIMSIAYQLSTQVPEYERRLKGMRLEGIVKESNAKALFDLLIVQPLSRNFPPPGATAVIIIDGLDEATCDGRNELASFIATEFSRTPEWLRLILTSRPDPEVTYPLQGLTPFVLDAGSKENLDDIDDYLMTELKSYAPDGNTLRAACNAIHGKSEGNFLYVNWVREELSQDRLSLDRVDEFPQGLGGIYADFFSRQFKDLRYYDEHIRPALNVIAAAQEPVDLQLIADVLGWGECESNDFQLALGSLFSTNGGKLQPFHRSLMDWLTDRNRSRSYFVSIRDGHVLIADHGWQHYQKQPSNMSRYLVAHLPAHLLNAGYHQELWTVLTDLTFIEEKCAAGMIYQLIEDYLFAGNRQAAVPDVVGDFARFVQSHAHILTINPSLTLQQAANQPDGSPVAKAAMERLKNCADGHLWLRLANKSCTGSESSMVLTGHADTVWSCGFSPDGTIILSGSEDGTIRLWNARTGEAIKTIKCYRYGVTSCVFSPDGSKIASGSWDGTLKIWDAMTGRELTAIMYDRTLPGKDVADVKNISDLLFSHNRSLWACAYSADGTLLSSGYDDGSIVIRNTNDYTVVRILKGHAGPVRSCAFSPDGSRLISSSSDRTLIFWDVSAGIEVVHMAGHSDAIGTCAILPDSRVISGSRDGLIKIWDGRTGLEVASLRGHSGAVNGCAVSRDGARMVSCSTDKTLNLWDLKTNTLVTTLIGHSGPVESCAFSGDSAKIVSASADRSLMVWDTVIRESARTSDGHDSGITVCVFSPDGSRVVTGSEKGEIKIWDSSGGRCLVTFKAHNGKVRACTFTPDSRFIVSGSGTWITSELRAWDVSTGDLFRTFSGHTRVVNSCAFSPDGMRMVSGSQSRALKLWDFYRGELLATLDGHNDSVEACAYSPDGKYIVSASRDKTLWLWDGVTGKATGKLAGHAGVVKACAFSPDGRYLISASVDRTLKIWDVGTCREIATLSGHSRAVSACAFSPDGKLVISGSRDRTIKIWDFRTVTEVITLKGYMDSVLSCIFSPDGRLIASVSEDGFIKIWDVATGRLLTEYGVGRRLSGVSWSPDGRTIAVGDQVGRLHLLRLENLQL